MEDKKIRSLMVAVNRLDGIYYNWAKSLGIKGNILALLYALSDGRQHTQKEICEEWLIPKTTINTVVKECIADGYVWIKKRAENKEKQIALTENGTAYTKQLLSSLKDAEHRAFEKTKKQYGAAYVEALEDYVKNMQEDFKTI